MGKKEIADRRYSDAFKVEAVRLADDRRQPRSMRNSASRLRDLVFLELRQGHWSIDFVMDSLAKARSSECPIVEDFTRKSLDIAVGRRSCGNYVARVLEANTTQAKVSMAHPAGEPRDEATAMRCCRMSPM